MIILAEANIISLLFPNIDNIDVSVKFNLPFSICLGNQIFDRDKIHTNEFIEILRALFFGKIFKGVGKKYSRQNYFQRCFHLLK